MSDRGILPPLWVNGFAYGSRVLNAEPWADPANMGLFCRDLASLLRLDFIDIDIEPYVVRCLGGARVNPEDFFETEAWLTDMHAAIESVAAACPQCRFALSFPSLESMAVRLLGDDGADDLAKDDLALGLANLVRRVAGRNVAAVMVRDVDPATFDVWEPLVNVADHLGVSLTATGCAPLAGFLTYCPDQVLAASFWHGETVLPKGRRQTVYTTIPPEAEPEKVQDTLSLLLSSL